MAVDSEFDAALSLPRENGATRRYAAGPAGLLAASADRERALDILRAGFAEGRLTKAEHDDRTARVCAARTYDELGALIADLPAGPLGGTAPYPSSWYPAPSARSDTNSMALAALACGICTFFTLGLTAIPAVVLGLAARRQLRRTGQRGDSMALTGLILGWTGVALIAVAVAALVVIAGHSAQPADHAILPVVIKPAVPVPVQPGGPLKPG